MISLRRILLPTDFSDNARDATAYACELAKQFNAELHVLHVLQIHIDTTPTFGAGLAPYTPSKESKDAADRELAKVIPQRLETAFNVVQATREGAPFVEIIRYAKENKIDMIVMGTHGRTGLSHLMIGSQAERVVRKSPCPVLTVRPSDHEFVMP